MNEVADFKRRVAKEHTVALGALSDLDHHGKATNGFDGLFHVEDVPHVDGFWNGDSIACKDLRSVEFVPALEDALAGVGGPDAQLFDVTQHRHAVLGDGVADAGNDGIFGGLGEEDIHAALVHDK